MQGKKNTATKLAVKNYFKQIHRGRFFSVLSLLLPGISTTLTTYIPPLVIAAAIRDFNGRIPTNLNALVPYLIVLTIVWSIGEILWRIAFLALNKVDSDGIASLNIEALDILLKKDAGFFSDNFAGSLTKKAIGYGKSFETFMDTLTFNIVGNLIPLLFAIVILWTFSPWIVVVLIGIIAFAGMAILPLIRKRQKLVYDREIASNVMAGYLADVLGNAAAVRAFGHEAVEKSAHAQLARDYTNKARKSWDYHSLRIDGVTAPLNILINVIGLILAITLTDNAGTLAVVFVTFSYFVQTSKMMFEFNKIYRNIESSISEAAQFTEIMLSAPKVVDITNAKNLLVSKGVICFKDVTFTHAENNDALFEKLNLKITSGEKVGIIGRSGAGKSTITSLLLRFMDVDTGSITIDGQNISSVTQESLRKNIAYVAQESVLFHRSLADNIKYGKLGANRAEVEKAARSAHAHEFISNLPQTYDTFVGERGVKLSGGQRQRIAIARAILKDAPILLLDEATSALDSESEKLIQDALNKLMENRTTIVIAHRLSTIQKMDRIIVLDQGRIVEEGSHKELLLKQGTYAKLWAHQSGGFLED